MEGRVKYNLRVESVMEGLAHLPSGLVNLVDNPRKHLQPLFGDSAGSPLARILGREQWCPAPGPRYLGKEAVLDGVEFGTVGRIVHDKNFHPDTVGKVHEILFDNIVPAGIGTSAITEDDKHVGIGIELLHVVIPYILDVLTHKFGGVVAGAYRKIAGIACQVVNAMRHNRPIGEGFEVVVERLGRCGAKDLSGTLEIANHLLLLGVYADNGYAGLGTSLFHSINLRKLGIPVLHLAQRKALEECPLPESRVFEHLPYDVRRHDMALFKEHAADLLHAKSEPCDILVLREACHMTGNDVVKNSHPFRVLADFLLCPSSSHALPAIGRIDIVGKFKNCLGNGIWRTSESSAYIAYRTARGARRLARNKMPSIAFFERIKVLHFSFANLYWRFFLHRCNELEINYKDTKIPPVIKCLKC